MPVKFLISWRYRRQFEVHDEKVSRCRENFRSPEPDPTPSGPPSIRSSRRSRVPSGHAGADRTLGDIAREASLAAERVAIVDTLRQVQWNRRRAAQMLGVCYKTLRSKIKEAGIDRP